MLLYIYKGKQNKKEIENEKIITLTLFLILLMSLFTGCGNRQIFDTYRFDTAIIQLGNEIRTYKIQKWKDFDGDQLQVILEDGTVILTHATNVLLIQSNEKSFEF